MSNKKLLFIISIFILILTSVRIGWIFYHKVPVHPQAEEGVIDFSEWQFTDDQAITLNGEWEFYPNEFHKPNSENTTSNKTYLAVPGDWQEPLSEQAYGSYRLKILLPEKGNPLYGIKATDILTSSRIYVNGDLIAESGEIATAPEKYKGALGPYTVFFQPHRKDLELIIHVANFDPAYFGGIAKPITFGTAIAVNNNGQTSIMLQLIVCAILLLHSIYAISLYLIGTRRKELIFYSLLLIFAVLSILIDEDKILYSWFDIDTKWSTKLMFLSFIGVLFFILNFIQTVFDLKSRLIKWLLILYGVLTFLLVIIPAQYVMYIGNIVMITNAFSYTVMFIILLKIIKKGNKDAIFILLSNTGNLINTIWGIGINVEVVNTSYYPYDFIISIMAFTFFLFKRHINISEQNSRRAIELNKADKVKDEFLANTSHELRNPLHGVINIAQAILDDRDKSLTDTDKSRLNLLIQIGQGMTFTLNDILDITKLKNKHIELNKQVVHINSTVNGVMNMLEFMTNGKEITFVNDIPEEFPYVLADENRLIQILLNLLHNSVKYTNKGTITVYASSKNNIATIYINDTGVGIAEEIKQHIFLPYKQEKSSLTAIGGGIGLGLSICKQLVELHGGTISVDSKKGEGSTFSFTLELADHTAELSLKEIAATTLNIQPSFPPSKQNTEEHKANILVVDDDPINLSVVSHLLSHEYNVYTALNGTDALTQINNGEWDLVISDVMMPQMSGYELTQKIRLKYSLSELPVLLLTARGQSADIQTAFQVGANDYVIKPVDRNELKARVIALTEMKQSVKGHLRMEAAWLQAQIRPHFLFNTLNTIASLAEIDTQRMVRLLQELGTYLQRSFDATNTLTLVPLENELKLTHSYLYIEKERFGERIKVEYDMTLNDTKLIKVPPLSIQPLVENAIEHGILKRANGGTVSIKMTDHQTHFTITISDDGVGMTQTQVDKVLSGTRDERTGIGLPNTNRRLQKLFGKGLTIESTLDQGTFISMDIPYQNE